MLTILMPRWEAQAGSIFAAESGLVKHSLPRHSPNEAELQVSPPISHLQLTLQISPPTLPLNPNPPITPRHYSIHHETTRSQTKRRERRRRWRTVSTLRFTIKEQIPSSRSKSLRSTCWPSRSIYPGEDECWDCSAESSYAAGEAGPAPSW
jgi:hypothetical protein